MNNIDDVGNIRWVVLSKYLHKRKLTLENKSLKVPSPEMIRVYLKTM